LQSLASRSTFRTVLPQNVDLNLLRVFLAIYEQGSLTRAADHLCLTQPTVSYALAKLRVLFDDSLFKRTPRGVEPTETGTRAYRDISAALTLVEHAVSANRSFDPAQSQRRFRISMSDIGELVFLPLLLERLCVDAPNAQLEVVPVPVEQVPDMLATGRLDAAIGYLPGIPAGSTVSESLFKEHYVCLMNAKAGPKGDAMTIKDFIAVRHVLVSSPITGHRMVEDVLREHDVMRQIVVQTTNFTGLPGLLARTDLVAVLPSRVAKVFQGYAVLRILDMPIDIPQFDVRMHWHAERENFAASVWLRHLVIDAMRELS
jgi:DNA-binding transcriptional LysR family regulator